MKKTQLLTIFVLIALAALALPAFSLPQAKASELKSTTLTIQVTPSIDKYMPDSYAVISGYLTSDGIGVTGGTVNVRYNDGSGSGWQDLYSVETNDGAYFVYFFVSPNRPNGFVAFEATFAGNDNYLPSGPVYTGEVGGQAGNLHVVPEYAIGTLAALGACFVGFAIFKKRINLSQIKNQN